MTKNNFNIIFAGTPAFAATALEALVQSHHKVIAVYTQPDRPAGRGLKLTPSPVKQLALQHQLRVHEPVSLRDEKEQKILKDLNADVMVVAAYGLILPKEVLGAPRWGCINIHPSLLPLYRGAAPIQRALQDGKTETGITIMRMEEGLDTGPMLYIKTNPIDPTDNSQTLQKKLAKLGGEALLETLEQLDHLQATPQDELKAVYAHKITKDEARIDWNLSAEEINNKIRAFNPWPVAWMLVEKQIVRVWEAKVIDEEKISAQPGTILNIKVDSVEVATGKGILQLQKIQLPGGKMLPVADVLNAHKELFLMNKVI